MSTQTLKEFYVEWRKKRNPITGEQNLYKDMTDEIIWNAAFKAAKSPNSADPKLPDIEEVFGKFGGMFTEMSERGTVHRMAARRMYDYLVGQLSGLPQN